MQHHIRLHRHSEAGRSMVEMLGVLAIMGILSITAMAVFGIAMIRYRANEILSEAHKRALFVSAIIAAGNKETPQNLTGFNNEGLWGVEFANEVDIDSGEINIDAYNVPEKLCKQMKTLAGQNKEAIVFIDGDCTTAEEDGLTFVYNEDLKSGVYRVTCTEDTDCQGCQTCQDGICEDTDDLCNGSATCSDGVCLCSNDQATYCAEKNETGACMSQNCGASEFIYRNKGLNGADLYCEQVLSCAERDQNDVCLYYQCRRAVCPATKKFYCRHRDEYNRCIDFGCCSGTVTQGATADGGGVCCARGTHFQDGECVEDKCEGKDIPNCMACDPLTGNITSDPNQNDADCYDENEDSEGVCYNGTCVVCASCMDVVNGVCTPRTCGENQTCDSNRDVCICTNPCTDMVNNTCTPRVCPGNKVCNPAQDACVCPAQTVTVVLTDDADLASTNKIPLMRALREIMGIGLPEAKALVDNLAAQEVIVKECVSPEEAEEIANTLTEAGGTASFREH